jgi:hypothetical protein
VKDDTQSTENRAYLQLAYADPPYYGSCQRYGHEHGTGGCWNDLETHTALLDRLGGYDGWALSCTTNSLRHLLPMCPEKVRVLAWVKPWATWKKGVSPAYAWEPVLVKAARRPPAPEDRLGTSDFVPVDWMQHHIEHGGFTGAKPLAVCRWIFQCMGADRDDTLEDLFHGSGAVKRAWEHYRTHLTLFPGDRPDQGVLDGV